MFFECDTPSLCGYGNGDVTTYNIENLHVDSIHIRELHTSFRIFKMAAVFKTAAMNGRGYCDGFCHN